MAESGNATARYLTNDEAAAFLRLSPRTYQQNLRATRLEAGDDEEAREISLE